MKAENIKEIYTAKYQIIKLESLIIDAIKQRNIVAIDRYRTEINRLRMRIKQRHDIII